jgi:hypothetical protein
MLKKGILVAMTKQQQKRKIIKITKQRSAKNIARKKQRQNYCSCFLFFFLPLL